MRPWQAVTPGQLKALEDEALASINAVLGRFGQAPFDSVAQLFDVAEDTLLGFPELDHYADRGPARYWGNLPDAGVGDAPSWPKLPGKRIFGYLRTGTGITKLRWRRCMRSVPPLSCSFPMRRRRCSSAIPRRTWCSALTPLALAQTAHEADAAVTYASMSTATSFLLKGKPLLLLPGHLEQFLLARRIEEMGAGLMVNPEQPAADLELNCAASCSTRISR